LIWVEIEEDDEGKAMHFGGRAVLEIVARQSKNVPSGRLKEEGRVSVFT
jgi:hypothetical protein